MSNKPETLAQRAARRLRNNPPRPRQPASLPASKNGQWYVAHLRDAQPCVETHTDGQQHVVLRMRLNPRVHDRSKYNTDGSKR